MNSMVTMAVIGEFIFLASVTCCLAQSITQYTMHSPTMLVAENIGMASVCLSRTGNSVSSPGNVFLSTQSGTAISNNDFQPLDNFALLFNSDELNKCFGITIEDDTDVEFKERFTVTIVGASDGVPGSQPSTEITIEENDYCAVVPLANTVTGTAFYLSPWTPTPGNPIVFTNTILASFGLEFLFATSDRLDSYYLIQLEDIASGNNGAFRKFVPGEPPLNVVISGVDIQQVSTETIEMTYEQATGTFTLTYSSSPTDQRTFIDTTATPRLAIRHIFVRVTDTSASGSFTLCGADLSRKLQSVATDQSGISQTTPSAVASLATDGNRNSVVGDGSCSITGSVNNPWWRVDLGQEYEVTAVNIFPVQDMDPSGLDDDDIMGAEIYVGSCDSTFIDQLKLCGNAPSDIINDLTVISVPLGNGVVHPVYIPCTSANTYGRYVYIRLSAATSTLPLCEVEVYGTQIPFGSETTVSFVDQANTVGEEGANIPVSLEISGPGSSCTEVDLYTVDGTAISSGTSLGEMDFTAIPKATPMSVVFQPGTPMPSVNIPINDDTVCEAPESFNVILDNIRTGVLGATKEKMFSITDTDSTQYSIENAVNGFEVIEGESRDVVILRTSNSNVLMAKRSVVFLSNKDGTNTRSMIEFTPGEARSQTNIATVDNNAYQVDRTFNIELETTDACDTLLPGSNMATVTVRDNDSRFYFDDVSIQDGILSLPENAGERQIRIRRDGIRQRKTVDIGFECSGDGNNAQSGGDFILSTTSVSFEANKDEAYVTLMIQDDIIRESEEGCYIILSDPEKIEENIKEPNRFRLVIVDDDAIYSFEKPFYAVTEHAPTIDVCIKRTGSLSKSVSIELGTRDISTTVNLDYRAPSAIVFPTDESRICISIPILTDSLVEETETFLVFFENDNIQTEFDTEATVDIYDGSDVSIGFQSASYSVSEGDQLATVVITKDGDLQQTVVASISSSHITTDGSDYVSVLNRGVRIPSGHSHVTFEVPIINDEDDESDEQFQLTLSNVGGGRISNDKTVITIRDDDDDDGNDGSVQNNTNEISGAALAGIIAGAVVITLVSALGVALFCAYLWQRSPGQISNPQPQRPYNAYPPSYGYGNRAGGQLYGQRYYAR